MVMVRNWSRRRREEVVKEGTREGTGHMLCVVYSLLYKYCYSTPYPLFNYVLFQYSWLA